MSSSAALLLERVRAATADEYTIESELGRGGMAAVFLARDIALERRVAIKVMLPDLIDVEGIQDRFVIEAKTSALLDHPGIVTVYSVKQRAGLLFIVMKFVEGRTLESLLKAAGPLNPHVAMMIVRQVAEALQFAHSEGVVHRDVKPSNIIIDTRGRPIVTDFGIAKVMAQKSITVTGSMLGTPTYMSPEQCRGLPATAASDQYSLGVMAYEMLSGKVPFTGTIYELIHAHCVEPPPPISSLNLDKGIEATVLRMLAKSPPERWESLSEVARALAGTMPAHTKSEEMQAVVAGYVRGDSKTQVGRSARTIDLAGQATQVARTPVTTTPAPGLVVTPEAPSIEVGQTVQMRVSQSSGASLAGVNITWQSEDATIATVDDRGLVTGRSVGLAKITVRGGAAIGRVAVTVRATSADTLVITPQNPEIVAGAEIQFVATVLDARGTTLTGQPIIWQSSDAGVCAISGQGRAIGGKPGKATITAICGDIQATAQARVRLPAVERVTVDPGEVSIEFEDSKKLTATVYAAMDRKVTDRTVTWRSTVPTVVSVDTHGTIKGVSPGTAAVIATCEGKDGIASISVRSQPVVAVRIQPEQLQLEVGRSLQLNGTGEDRRGRPVTDKNIEWQSENDNIAIVDASGKVHAVKEGRTVVRATAGDVTSTIGVSIIPRVAATIRIDAHKATLEVGEFLSLDATVLDAEGGSLKGRPIVWTSTNPAILAIDSNGTCEAKKPGAARITAASGQARASTKLSVSIDQTLITPSVHPPTNDQTVVTPGVKPPRDGSRDAETQKLEAVTRPQPKEEAKAHQTSFEPRWAPRGEEKAPPSAVEPTRKRTKAVPIGIVLAMIAAVGVWAATKGDGPTPTPPPIPDTVAQRAPDTPRVAVRVESLPPRVGASGSTGGGGARVVGPSGASGALGLSGASGASGRSGPSGRSGASGASGPSGVSGAGGASGRVGASGNSGASGTSGTAGTSGSSGPSGASGTSGSGGTSGGSGVSGVSGASGASGASGNSGASGTSGGGSRGGVGGTTGRVDPIPTMNCADGSIANRSVVDAFGSDPVAAIGRLYQIRGASDTKARDNLTNDIKRLNNLTARVRPVSQDAAGAECSWIVEVVFEGRMLAGSTKRTWQMTVVIEPSGSAGRVKSISGADRR